MRPEVMIDLSEGLLGAAPAEKTRHGVAPPHMGKTKQMKLFLAKTARFVTSVEALRLTGFTAKDGRIHTEGTQIVAMKGPSVFSGIAVVAAGMIASGISRGQDDRGDAGPSVEDPFTRQ